MRRILVWDVPTRALHWLLTGSLGASLGIAMVADHDSIAFQIHMLLGLIAGFVVVQRLAWGIVGSRYARFGSFLFGPKALLHYLRCAWRRTGERHLGHNPGSAYSIYGMLLLALALAITGVLLPAGMKLAKLHEPMAHLMVLLVGAHVAGIVWHTIQHRDNIALSMLDGTKPGEPKQAIRSSHPLAGVLFLALSLGWTWILFDGYDAQARRLRLFGQTIHLGEPESENSEAREHDQEHHGQTVALPSRRAAKPHSPQHGPPRSAPLVGGSLRIRPTTGEDTRPSHTCRGSPRRPERGGGVPSRGGRPTGEATVDPGDHPQSRHGRHDLRDRRRLHGQHRVGRVL